MSLESLREMRRTGYRPEAVLVVVGNAKLPMDEPNTVIVDRIGADLRPLVGMPVFVIFMDVATTLATHVIDALQGLNTRLLGASCHAGELGATDEHAEFARTYRRWLCEMT